MNSTLLIAKSDKASFIVKIHNYSKKSEKVVEELLGTNAV